MGGGVPVVSCYKGGGGDSQSQRSLPRSSDSPSPEAPAWRLEDHAVGTSGEQLPGQGQSRSRGTGWPALEPSRPTLPRGAAVNTPDVNPCQKGCTLQCRHTPHKTFSPTQPMPQKPVPSIQCPTPADPQQISQLLCASVASLIKGTQHYSFGHGLLLSFYSFNKYSLGAACVPGTAQGPELQQRRGQCGPRPPELPALGSYLEPRLMGKEHLENGVIWGTWVA